MNKNKKLIIGIVLALAVLFLNDLFLIWAISGQTPLGGTVENYPTWWTNGLYGGSNKQFSVDSNGTVTQGGSVVTLTATSTIMSGSTLCGMSVLDFETPGVFPAGISPVVTLPSATNTPCLVAAGTSKTFYVNNNGGNYITLSGNYGGITFTSASSTAGVANVVGAANRAIVNVVRATSTSALLYFINSFR